MSSSHSSSSFFDPSTCGSMGFLIHTNPVVSVLSDVAANTILLPLSDIDTRTSKILQGGYICREREREREGRLRMCRFIDLDVSMFWGIEWLSETSDL